MADKKHLYCCSSYYQLLISLIKSFTQRQKIDLVLEEHGIETASQLAQRLECQTDCVGKVFVCPNSETIDPYQQRCASFFPWQRRQILSHMEQVFAGAAFSIPKNYDTIHVFWDLGYAGTYFNICKICYTLHEDSLNSYQHIRENRRNYSYLFRKWGLKYFFKKYLHMGVMPFGYSDCCNAVEVNDRKGIQIPQEKVREVPRAELESQLSQEQRETIYDIFMGDLKFEISSIDHPVLILTEPFAVTGRLPDLEIQAKLYHAIQAEYAKGENILIKPHPRDSMDYKNYFPRAKVLAKNVPMEVLNFHKEFKVSKAITVTSSALQGIHCAEEKIYLGQEFLHKFIK